jgi:hypothetical protein
LSSAHADATTPGDQFHGLNGQTLFTNIASSDPGFAGQVWNDAGTLKISAGNAWSQIYRGHGIELANSTTLPLMRVRYHGGGAPYDWSSVLGSVGKSTGKWYFECQLVDFNFAGFGSSNLGGAVGVALNTMLLEGTASNGFGFAGHTGSVGLQSGQTASAVGNVFINAPFNYTPPTHASVAGLGFVEGDTVQVAVDCDADRIWFALNNTGTWNGGAGTPAAGTGGYSIAAITGTVYPVCSIHKNCGTYDASNVMHESMCWEGFFAVTNYAPPTGFTRWA